MTKQNSNRLVHIAGALLCLTAIMLALDGTGLKTVITILVGSFGLIGNAWGVMRPNTWLH